METLNNYNKTLNDYSKDSEAIVRTLQLYIDGSLAGKSELMHPGFHPEATIVGYFGGSLVSGPIQKLYDLIDGNGPAYDIQPQIVSIEILDSIAIARLEVAHWTGNVIGTDSHMSDLFNLIKTEAGWKITHKMFHLHAH
jgi:hypothetical protein